MKVVSTSNAPAAIGPYSQALDLGNMVFVSGQIPVDPATGKMADSVEEQAAQLLQKSQFAVQCSLQYRIQGPGGGLPHTDGLGFQHGGAQVVAPVGGALEQCGLKLRRGVTHRAHAVDAGFHAVGQIHQSGDHRIFQQGAEDDKPVQTGVPFSQFHILFPL